MRSVWYNVFPSSYYLQQWLLSPTFKLVGMMWLHAQGTVFIAECYRRTFMVTMNALQLDLHLVPTCWADYRTQYNIIAANCSSVGYFVAPSKPTKVMMPCKRFLKHWWGPFLWSWSTARNFEFWSFWNEIELIYMSAVSCYAFCTKYKCRALHTDREWIGCGQI